MNRGWLVVGALALAAGATVVLATWPQATRPPASDASADTPIKGHPTDDPRPPRRRFIEARHRLRPPMPFVGLRREHHDALQATDAIEDAEERRSARTRLGYRHRRRREEIWDEGHMESAGQVARLLGEIRFEAARTYDQPPADVSPFEITLISAAGNYTSGIDAYTEPMRAAAAACRRHQDAPGRLGELARECVGLAGVY